MSDQLDWKIKVLVDEIVEEAPPTMASLPTPTRANRPWTRPLLSAAVLAVLVGIGAIVWQASSGSNDTEVDTSAALDADPTVVVPDEAPDFFSREWTPVEVRLPAIFERPRMILDELPTDLDVSIGGLEFSGGFDLDADRSRRGVSTDEVTMWVAPSTDDRVVCIILQTNDRSPTSSCGELELSAGRPSIGHGGPAGAFTAGVFGGDIVDVVDALVVDGTYVFPGAFQPGPEFVFRDGSTQRADVFQEAQVAACEALGAAFLSGAATVDVGVLRSFVQSAQQTHLPDFVSAANAIEQLLETVPSPTALDDPRWAPAIGSVGGLCSGFHGFQTVVIGGQLGPEPLVDLADYGRQTRLGRLPEVGGIDAGGLRLARDENNCVWAVMTVASLRRVELKEPERLGCEGSRYRWSGELSTLDMRIMATIVEVPDDVAFVVFGQGSSEPVVQRPVNGLAAVWEPGSRSFTVEAYDEAGEPVPLP